MDITPHELDRLMIHALAENALQRKMQGLKLTHPEAVAVLYATALNEARAGKSVEEVLAHAQKILSKNDVVDGVADKLHSVQVDAMFPDGNHRLIIPHPIN